MPKRNTVAVPVVAAAEPKKARSASKPKASAATHKLATKIQVEDSLPTAEAIVETAPLAAAATTTPVTNEQIAHLAYCYWEARGYQGGSPEHDWICAERELTGRA